MKLCEAMMGQDLRGCHFESVFRADGFDSDGSVDLYPEDATEANMEARRGPYLRRANANVYRLVDVYGKGHTGAFDEDVLVLCDVYGRRRPSGKTTGMPILCYRADPNGTAHDVNDPDNPDNIYDYTDNQMLVRLGVPGKPWATHPLGDPKRFYMNTRDARIGGQSRPHRTDSFILISAGYDGLYGTADNICNFDWKYRE